MRESEIQIKDQYIMGRHPVIDALKNKEKIEKVWIDKAIRGPVEKEIRFLCRQEGIHLQVVPKEKLDYLVRRKNHQGVAAQIAHIIYYDMNDVVQWCYEQGEIAKILILDGVEDIRNIGAVSRSALWFGFHAIVVPSKGTARINAAAIKSSAGALLRIKVCKMNSIEKAIQQLKEQGIKVFAADANGDEAWESKVSKDQGLALVLGAEGKGISSKTKEEADCIVSIDGSGKMESLNVSVAGGILMHRLFELMKLK